MQKLVAVYDLNVNELFINVVLHQTTNSPTIYLNFPNGEVEKFNNIVELLNKYDIENN